MPVIKAHSAPDCPAFSILDIEQQALALLEEARRDADAILEDAREQGEAARQRIVEEARRQGLEEGRLEGLELGRAEGRAESLAGHASDLTELTQVLQGLVEAFDADREALAARAADEVTRLAIAIAGRVCRQAAQLDPGVCAQSVTAAVRMVLRAHDIRLHVHPEDLNHISNLLPSIQQRWPTLKHIELHGDPALSRGGCRIFTGGGMIDADLETQLQRITADLVPGERPDAAEQKPTARG